MRYVICLESNFINSIIPSVHKIVKHIICFKIFKACVIILLIEGVAGLSKFLFVWLFQNQCLRQVKLCFALFLFHCLFPLGKQICDAERNQRSNRKYILELIKRRSKFHQTNMLCESTLSFYQSETFFEIYKPTGVLL